MKRVNVAAATVTLLAWASSSFAANQAIPLIRENEVAPGSAGEIATSLDSVTTNGVGGYAIQVNLSASGDAIWGSVSGGAPGVMRSEMQIGALLQTTFEFTIGLADNGSLCYAPTTNLLDPNGRVAVSGLDALYLNDTLVLNEGDNVTGIFDPNWCSTFNSRPNITNSGIPYWIGGAASVCGAATGNRALLAGNPPVSLFQGGDNIGGVGLPANTSTIDFDTKMSANGTHYISLVFAAGAPVANDNVMIIDGSAISANGGLLREGDAVPLASGGLAGELWSAFDSMNVTESGEYFVTGDTNAAVAVDEFVVKNGAIILREGDSIGGNIISGSIETGAMNESGDWAVTWDFGTPETLILNGRELLTEGALMDWNGDGVLDANDRTAPGDVRPATLVDFSGLAPAMAIGERDADGLVTVYFTADVDFQNTTSTTDDREALWAIRTHPCPGDLTGDGAIDLSDLAGMLAAFGTSSGGAGYTLIADLDMSGTIDLADLAGLLSVFGTTCLGF
ncbi:MAG: hypothetical protein KDA32_09285 [Phycisphaerales bacterium]|nr:hypothetical protein [Phycisphaerales bacterium]